MPEGLSRSRDRRSMRMVWKTLRMRHLGLAFFWACSMLTFRSSILLSGPFYTTGYQTLVVIVSFVANMTTLFLVAARMERNPSFYDKLPASAFTACIMAGLGLLAGSGVAASSGFLPGEVALAPLLAGAVLAGVGYGYFWGSWAECLGRMHPSRTSFYLPAVLLLTALLFVAFSFCSEELGVPALLLMLPLPVLSQLCLTRCNREVPSERAALSTDPQRYRTALGSLVSLIVASLVLSCLFGYVWQMTVVSVDSAYEAHRLPLIANVVAAVALIGLVLFARRRIDLALTFKVIVPILVVLFALMPAFWTTNPVELNVVMSACYGVFDVIIWYMVASTAYDLSVSGFVVGGIVRGISIIARLVGIGIGYVVMLIPESPSILVIGVSVGAVYVLAMLALLQNTRHRFSFLNLGNAKAKEESEPAAAQGPEPRQAAAQAATALESGNGEPAPVAAALAEPDGDVFDQISDYYGLTRREAEVLPYLARGRSAKVIAEALFVSESTVRTHTRRILEKTALHSKQDLIDLIEKYE
ncbi:response regulator transcription factor [Eggerthella timonensis]|uniref:response regulator transcription factor n=1 Tax=Eggerthella timonensis TaxID=1871008 RepID=UPI000C7854AE|nr:helix-turn-helix transcriptional regulator [Eggerthella timonensis]